jgi:hypothetical protein
LLLLVQAPSAEVLQLVCCYGDNTTQLSCIPFSEIPVDAPFACMEQYNGTSARGRCDDTLNPCDIGSCCSDPQLAFCSDGTNMGYQKKVCAASANLTASNVSFSRAKIAVRAAELKA